MRNVTWITHADGESASADVLAGYMVLTVKRPVSAKGAPPSKFFARVGERILPGRFETMQAAKDAAEYTFAALLKDAAKLYAEKE